MCRSYQTFGVWFYHELLPLIGRHAPDHFLEVNGASVKIKMHGTRMECFRRTPKCHECGIVGEVFLLQRNPHEHQHNIPHLNLYAIKRDRLILMTQDHVIPWCMGEKRRRDKEDMRNLITACEPCNAAKGASLPKWMGGGLL